MQHGLHQRADVDKKFATNRNFPSLLNTADLGSRNTRTVRTTFRCRTSTSETVPVN